MNRPIETQLAAARGYAAWLTSTLAERPDESRDINRSILAVVQVYASELQRQSEGIAATADWLGLISLTRTIGPLAIEELLEQHAGLAAYDPGQEPKSVHEMAIRLLCDAIALFNASVAEMATQLQTPVAVVTINDFIKRVLG